MEKAGEMGLKLAHVGDVADVIALAVFLLVIDLHLLTGHRLRRVEHSIIEQLLPRQPPRL